MSNRKKPDQAIATCRVDVKPFRAALLGVAAALQRRVTIPILSHVLLDVRDTAMRITATDLERQISASVPVDALATPFKAAVPGSILIDLVRTLPDGGEVTLGLTAAGDMSVVCGRARASLRTLDAGDYPSLAAPADGAVTIAIAAADLHHLMAAPALAISTEETRYYLNGICLHVADDTLRAVATDGHRLVQCHVALPDAAAGLPQVIVPRQAVADFAAAAKEAGDDVVGLVVSATIIELTTTHRQIRSKLIDGQYPDYARIIPRAAGATTAAVDVASMAAALATVRASAGREAKGVALDVDGTGITLTMTSAEGHSGEDAIDALVTGKDVRIGFNPKYLVEALGVAGTERVTLHIHEPGSPIVITADGSDVLAVVMPMKV